MIILTRHKLLNTVAKQPTDTKTPSISPTPPIPLPELNPLNIPGFFAEQPLTISGQALPEGRILILNEDEIVAETDVDIDGTWTIELSEGLAVGIYSLTIVVEDSTRRRSDPVPLSLLVDPAPTATSSSTISPTETELPTRTPFPSATPLLPPSRTPTTAPTEVALIITSTETPTTTSTNSPSPSTTATDSPTEILPSETLAATVTNSLEPSNTPSVLPSLTETITQTASPSPTNTPTEMVVAIVPSDTSTATVTSSPTSSNTPSLTVTHTLTLTLTNTVTLTATPTVSLTSTSTLTMTRSPTHTMTSTSSATSTASATLTPTASITSTATLIPTVTLTVTPTLSPTFTQTPSLTNTPMPTSTNTTTATSTSSQTSTFTLSPSPTATATDSRHAPEILSPNDGDVQQAGIILIQGNADPNTEIQLVTTDSENLAIASVTNAGNWSVELEIETAETLTIFAEYTDDANLSSNIITITIAPIIQPETGIVLIAEPENERGAIFTALIAILMTAVGVMLIYAGRTLYILSQHNAE